MLDQDTKRHIDSARDILVGKIPNPSKQIEQITTALIYKFMDDMDKENEELGGKASFFVDNLKDFSWSKLLSKQISGEERMDLYVRAIEQFSKSEHIPELFRNIFKDTFLPFRDHETLNLFIKEIDYFNYSNSENLGNAFEYLLSVLGSQGDAGQFRTPRHIIDFIVEVVNPKKDDTILDPACGTAGFLISSYKHIIRNNSSNYNKKKYIPSFASSYQSVSMVESQKDGKFSGDKLTPSQKKDIAKNITGYDISPDMVKLSLVNLYLHNFKNPDIIEYDTLAYDDHWDENFDVILANPPFMTPKGGIKPHKRFAIQANRSEVLFVDYIAEHLSINGKAGVIVPDGIIFQSSNAYKNLRKMLVDNNYLYAVVSLPAGVFNPYSGVKTSILFFDKELAKKAKNILFVKVENDGFDLGAQRKSIRENDLPMAFEAINGYQEYLKKTKNIEDIPSIREVDTNPLCHLVLKKEIAEQDYNLSGDRYKEVVVYDGNWDLVELSELETKGHIEFLRGQGISKKDIVEKGKYKCIHYGDLYTLYNPIINRVKNETNYDGRVKSIKGDVLVPATTTADPMGIAIARALNEDDVVLGGDINIIRTKNKIINSKFLSLLINYPLKEKLSKFAKGVNIYHLSNKDIKTLQIPFPPLEVQERIVDEIESYQNIIDGAKKVAQSYKPSFKIDPEWDVVELGDICDKLFAGGDAPKNKSKEKTEQFNIPIYSNGLGENSLYGYTDVSKVEEDAVTVSARGTIGYPEVRKAPFVPIVRLIVAIPNKDKINLYFLKYILETFEIYRNGNSIPQLTIPMIKHEKIPLPPIETQKEIVAQIEEEQKLVDSNKQLIEIYEQKIKDKIEEVWNK